MNTFDTDESFEVPGEPLEDKLGIILGDWYGGPAIGHNGTEFILYNWFDAPVSEEILATGKTLEELVENYEKKLYGGR